MRWPIDTADADPQLRELPASLGPRARARIVDERRIASRLGFASFADYYRDRRLKGWGLNRLARETGQSRDWVRGAVRRYDGTGA